MVAEGELPEALAFMRVLKDLEERGLIHVKGKTIVVFGTR